MKEITKSLRVLLMTALVLVMSATCVFAASTGTDWENSVIRAEGTGVPPATAYNSVQARMMARRAAIVDAYRQLAEQIKGVNVDATTTVENMMVTNDTVTTRVSALVQGARIVDEKVLSEGGYTVTLEVPVFGVSGSLASVVLPQQETKTSFPEPVSGVTPSVPSTSGTYGSYDSGSYSSGSYQTPAATLPGYHSDRTSSAASTPAGTAIGGYTGLIVDCRGLDLNPVMSPVIQNAEGTPIYGYKNLDSATVIQNGMAAYTTDINRASRAGSNPLVVRAIRVTNHNAYPVLSTADANRVLIENGASGFLDATNVVFVR